MAHPPRPWLGILAMQEPGSTPPPLPTSLWQYPSECWGLRRCRLYSASWLCSDSFLSSLPLSLQTPLILAQVRDTRLGYSTCSLGAATTSCPHPYGSSTFALCTQQGWGRLGEALILRPGARQLGAH